MCEEYKGELWRRASEQVRCGWVRMSNHSDNDIPNPMGWAGLGAMIMIFQTRYLGRVFLSLSSTVCGVEPGGSRWKWN